MNIKKKIYIIPTLKAYKASDKCILLSASIKDVKQNNDTGKEDHPNVINEDTGEGMAKKSSWQNSVFIVDSLLHKK